MKLVIALFCILTLSFSATSGGLSVAAIHGEHAPSGMLHDDAACAQHAVTATQSSSAHDCCGEDSTNMIANTCDEQCQTCCNDLNISHVALLTAASRMGNAVTRVKFTSSTTLPEAPHRDPIIPPII